MKDLRVELKVKNNLLYQAINRDYESVNAFCRDHGFTPQTVGKYLNFRSSPLTERHSHNAKSPIPGYYVKKTAMAICDALGLTFFDVFPPSSYKVKQNAFTTEIESQDFIPFDDTQYLPILGDNYDHEATLRAVDYSGLYDAINTLPDNERDVLIARFGLEEGQEETLDSIASKRGLSRQRIRDIERKALSHMRHPTRSRKYRNIQADRY